MNTEEMTKSCVNIELKIDSEQEWEILNKIQNIQDKLKETKLLSNELASILSNLKISVEVGTECN